MNKELGKRIKYYRLLKEMSRETLAKELGISIHTLAKYEQGQREPNIETLTKIATGLDVDLLTLIADDDRMVEEDDLKKIKIGVKDERIIYHKPSFIKEIDKKSKFYEYLENILSSEFLQEECNYKYKELVMQEDFDELVDFLSEMFKMKMDQIKLRKINKEGE